MSYLGGDIGAVEQGRNGVRVVKIVDGVLATENEGDLGDQSASRSQGTVRHLPIVSKRPAGHETVVIKHGLCPTLKIGSNGTEAACLRIERADSSVAADRELGAECVLGEKGTSRR